MTKEAKTVSFICSANYCRSPVAKMIFKNKYGGLLNVDSAGISPIVSAGMDPRSLEYLNRNKIPYEIHIPKKADLNFLDASDLIFAMDHKILMYMNKYSKKYSSKIKLFTFQHKDLVIIDPFNLSKEKYNKVMEDIKFVIDNLVFDKLFVI